MAAHPLDWLQRSTANAGIVAQAKEHAALEESLHSLLPAPLRLGCRVGQWQQGQLSLVASNTQVASRIRHLLPSLLKGLQRQWPIADIQLRVLPETPQHSSSHTQPKGVATSRLSPSAQSLSAAGTTAGRLAKAADTTSVRRLSPEALAAFGQLKNELPEGPLAEALRQLLKHHQQN